MWRDLGRRVQIEMRLDGAFVQPEIVAWLVSRAEYAIKVPFYPWLGLNGAVQRQRRWTRIASDLQAFEARVEVPTRKRTLRVAIYRRKVQHETRKNFQLDLFDPDDGHWEYSAITTNKTLGLKALWNFMGGRGAQEKILAQLKNGDAFDSVVSRRCAANSTGQILSVLAHNLIGRCHNGRGLQPYPGIWVVSAAAEVCRLAEDARVRRGSLGEKRVEIPASGPGLASALSTASAVIPRGSR